VHRYRAQGSPATKSHNNNEESEDVMTARSTRHAPPPADCPLDLCRDLHGISAQVLTQRLRRMKEQDLIARRMLPTRTAQMEYRFTATGREFKPVLDAMTRVARGIRG
jgi:hypothetical protein